MADADFPDITEAVPWNHFGRKNLGFLFAIKRGATMIWDFDDDNILKGPVVPIPESSFQAISVEGVLTFNPYPIFGPSTPRIWPRGFPLELVKQTQNISSLASIEFPGAVLGVVQSLADQDPDVDAVYRMTMDLPVYFNNNNASSTTVVLAKGVFSPFNAQATLHMRSAFWGLYLPVSVHGRVSDIWRSYICQRLMWDVGLLVAFVDPRVIQIRNAHQYSADFVAEDDLYKKSLALIQFLSQWNASSALLSDRLVELYVELYEREFVHLEDVKLVQLWVQALLDAGYQFPPAHTPSWPAGLLDPLPTEILGSSSAPAQTYAARANYLQKGLAPIHIATRVHHPSSAAAASAKRVLITGITGMIGSQIAKTILARYDWEVYGLVRWRSSLTNLQGVLHKIQLVKGDITDAFRMQAVISEISPDYIFHMAAQAINGVSFASPMVTMEVNVMGTLNLLEAVRTSPVAQTVRILLAGSSTVYGLAASDGSLPETAPMKPVSPYGVSKASAEMLVNQYFYDYGIQSITARFFIHVGAGGTDNLALQDFCKQIAMIELGVHEPILRHGNLDALRDVTDIEDSMPAVVSLIEVGTAGEAYNINSGVRYSTRQILDVALRLSPASIQTLQEQSRLRSFDEKVLVGDNSKLISATRWTPNPDLNHTVQNILNYWRLQAASLYAPRKFIAPILRQANPITACPTSNIDIFIVAAAGTFPMLDMLLRSIEMFMRCHGRIHIMVDEWDHAQIQTWIANEQDKIDLHIMPRPPSLENVVGYIKQAWIMMYADLYAKDSEYVLFMDTDAILALPVTCRSVFDEEGRILMPAWVLTDTAKQFKEPCQDFLGFECAVNYMSYFPLTMPTDSLARMREHIVKHMNAQDFDNAFSTWWNTTRKQMGFSQFVIMGNYLQAKEPSRIHTIICPAVAALSEDSECANFVHTGIHYGWRPCAYVGGCAEGGHHIHMGDGTVFQGKFSLALMKYLSDVMTQGYCLMMRLASQAHGCPPELAGTLHKETLTYQNRPVDMAIQDAKFKPDTEQTCPFVSTF